MEELIEQFQPFTPKNKPLSKKLFTEVVCFFMIVILRNFQEITNPFGLSKCPSAASDNLDIARYACDYLML